MYIIFLKKKCLLSCFDVHFISNKEKSYFIWLTPSPLQNIALLFGLRFTRVVSYRLCLNEFRIFIYLLCFDMNQPKKMKITELRYPKAI